MCSINHDKKAIFIHIPKNGGSYIAEILSKNYGFKNYYLQRPDHEIFCLGKDKSVDKHENKIHGTLMYYKTSNYINKIMNMDKKKWNSYFIFSFVRNPYDRIVSGWNYCNKYNIPFSNYLDLNLKASAYDYWHVFMTQTRHLIGNNGKININYIGKFENMEDDLKIILNKIGYQHINHMPFKKNSKKHEDYKTYYLNKSQITNPLGMDQSIQPYSGDDQVTSDSHLPHIVEKVNKIIREDLNSFDYVWDGVF